MKSSMSFTGRRQGLLKTAFICFLSMMAITATWFEEAQAGEARYSKITVDVAPIKETGLSVFADEIGAAVTRALLKTYAGAIDAKNKSLPTLIVEVATIYYGQEEETFVSKMAPGFTHTRDELSGTAIIRKSKTELKRAAIRGIHVTQGGWRFGEDTGPVRLQMLADQFASTVRDELGD